MKHQILIVGQFSIMPDNVRRWFTQFHGPNCISVQFVWLALNFVLSKLYSNSLLATYVFHKEFSTYLGLSFIYSLNTRNALRGRGEDTELLSTVTTLRITTSQTDTYEIENLRERKVGIMFTCPFQKTKQS